MVVSFLAHFSLKSTAMGEVSWGGTVITTSAFENLDTERMVSEVKIHIGEGLDRAVQRRRTVA